MDQHSIKLLEFDKILYQLKNRCLSIHGQNRLESEDILTESHAVKDRLALAHSFRMVLESGQSFSACDFPDISSLEPKYFKNGAQCEVNELSCLGCFIVSALRFKRILTKGSVQKTLAEIASEIPDLKFLAREIFSIIDKQGNILENKIPGLKNIRKKIRSLQKEMGSLTKKYLGESEYQSYWQDDLPTMRNGRTVLPLKTNFKGKIKGIVHEISSSGATVYLEPFDIIEKNNEITKEENLYKIELHRILKTLSAKVISSSEDLKTMILKVGELDALYARAVYAIDHECVPALAVESGIDLFQSKHPLLGKKAVPISLRLGDQNRMLIITGPNTGGKTVTLKTVGLLALMNQFGMEIPVQEGSSLSVFDNVFADIGDEQSIEQSLSTFSSHIINISRSIKQSSNRSLVLFDELGAGTDPEEGVAIAMSLLDHFIDKGCITLATTHHGILKNYGYSRSRVENASMEFDLKSLKPNFHLIMGIPGESHALEIAGRNGIPVSLIKQAQQYLKDERGDINELIKSLSEKKRELLDAEKEQKNKESVLKEKRRETDLMELRLRQKEFELRELGLVDIKRFLKQSRKELQHLINEIREKDDAIAASRKVQDFIRRLDKETENREVKLHDERENIYFKAGAGLREGIEVIIKGTGKRGRILRKGKRQTWIVETDTLRASFPPMDLRAAPDSHEQEVSASISSELGQDRAVFQLDVRGLRLKEAIQKLEKQIDLSLIQGLSFFNVVHGQGEGVLKKGINEYLSHRDDVIDYHFSDPREGGSGKTIVTLI